MNLHPTHPFVEPGSKREALACILSGCAVFAISLFISGLYTQGDQAGYHSAYEAIRGLGWGDGRALYDSRISGAEGIHYLLMLIGGALEIDKNLFMSIFNGILAAYAVRLFLCWGANLWLAIAMVLTNYYFYVLYFAAERLKFAFLFLVLSLLYVRKPFGFIACAFASLWSHFSVLFIYSGIWLASLPEKITAWRKEKAACLTLALSAGLVVLGLAFESEYLLWKLNTYIAGSEPFSLPKLVPVAGLLAFACLYAERRIVALLHFLPILIGVAILGGSRLNMLAYFIFLYYGLRLRGGLNVGVLLSMIYFTYKTLLFVSDVASHGHGFP